jgi:type II secretory pathway pseudopilin PulG
VKSTRRNPSATRAFTLVEVLAGTFVMALAIGSCVIAMQAGMKTIDYARHLTLASQVLQSEAERVRLLSWSQVQELPSVTTPRDIQSIFVADSTHAGSYALTLVSTPVAGRETTMREITLEVTWTGTFGTSHARTYRTRYCKDGLYAYYYTLAGS